MVASQSIPSQHPIFTSLANGFVALASLLVLTIGNAQAQPLRVKSTNTTTSSSSIQTRIINGSQAGYSAWPFMVALSASPQFDSLYSGHFCGGALISSRFVLTASHCVEGFESYPEGLFLGVGITDLSNVSASQIYRANAISLHPQADIALVRLSSEVVGISPIGLIQESEAGNLLAEDAPAMVLGWGRTSPDSSSFQVYPYFLQQAQIPVKTDLTCMQNLGRDFRPEIEMCAGKLASSPTTNDGIDTCYGDSGGPLLVKNLQGHWRIAGLTSRGVGCAGPSYYGIYASVLDSLDWISAFPPAAPRAISRPMLTGTAQVGQTVTCSPGVWAVDLPQAPLYVFAAYRNGSPESGFESNAPELQGVSGNKLLVGPELEGAYLECSEVVTNPSGTRYATSELMGPVAPAPAPVAVDSVGPSISLHSRSCANRRRCSVTVAVTDAGDVVSGVSAVTARSQFTYRECSQPKKPGKVSCRTHIKLRQYGAAQSVEDPSLYTFKFGASVKGVYRLYVSALDIAGNRSGELSVAVRSK